MKLQPVINSFTSGELSPYLYDRIDLDQYYSAAKTIENFAILPYGGLLRIPGTYFVAETKDSSKKSRLIPFKFNVTQSYILEFGDQYIRFYKDDGIIMDGGSPYEISTPYAEEDLPRLQFAQNADVMWIVHPDYKPKKLTRTGHTSWTLTDYTPTSDPFTSADNYPACVTFHEQRLWFGYTNNNPQTIWATKSGDFEDMTTGTADDDALQYTLGTNEVNVIRWLSALKVLSIGTSGGVLTMGSNDATTPITPTNVMVHRESNVGCYPIMPVLIGSYVYYLHRDGKRLMQFAYDFNSDSYQSIDVTILADHITGDGIVDMAYQQSPYNMLWCVRSDGSIAILTRNVLQKITGWSRKITNGEVESVAVIPRGDGDYDEVWFIVKRTINGSTKRYVEYLKSYDFSTIQDAFFVDCGLTYDGSPATTITGLDHLEGESVAILADGAVHPNKTVSGGSVTLEWAASKVQAGLSYTSTAEMLDLDVQNRFQTAFGRKKKILKALIDFYRTVGGYAGVGSSMDEIYFRDSSMAMDEAVPLFSGIKVITIPKGFDRQLNLKITQTQPLPMCVRGIGVDEVVNER